MNKSRSNIYVGILSKPINNIHRLPVIAVNLNSLLLIFLGYCLSVDQLNCVFLLLKEFVYGILFSTLNFFTFLALC